MKLLIIRALIAMAFVFGAMTASWSFGNYVRSRTSVNLVVGIVATIVTLALARLLKKLARRG